MHSPIEASRTVFIPAAPEYYATWVQSHLLAGDHVDDFRSGYPADGKDMLYATEDFKLKNETGADAKSIIMPEYVSMSGAIGHNNLYLFDGPKTFNVHSVAAWATPEFAEFADLLEPDFKRISRKAISNAQEDENGIFESDEDPVPVESIIEFYGRIAVDLGLDIPSL